MTQVEFYSLPDIDLASRTQLTCRLLEKALKNGNQVLVQVNDEDDAKLISDKIWGFKPESFIAHGMLDQLPANQIEIGWTKEHGKQHDLLIQLSDKIPEFYSRFERVIEITCQHQDVIQITRDHYRFYRDRGYPLKHHQLKAILGS